MGVLILAGQTLQAGEGQGQLSQYYGYADTTATTVTAAASANLSSVYTIPAGEAYAGAAYELACGGTGTWGSTQQQLVFVFFLGTAFGSAQAGKVAAGALAASATFQWSARMTAVCKDGVSAWLGSITAVVQENVNPANPGTASTNALPVTCAPVPTASVSSAINVAVQAFWGATTGSPTITNNWTTFRKIALWAGTGRRRAATSWRCPPSSRSPSSRAWSSASRSPGW